MKRIAIATLRLLLIGVGIQAERITLDPSTILTISNAEARRGRASSVSRSRGGRHAHRSVRVDVNHRGGRGGAFIAGAIVGSAVVAIGTRHTRLPPSCTSYDYYGRAYYHCGGVYYQPVYSGPEVIYVVVEKP